MPFAGSRIDVHTHILPQMDDGSASPEESLRMIRMAEDQGVRCICCTPHFYADRDNPTHFLKKRSERWLQLREYLQEAKIPVPRLMLGAEVAYFEGITSMEELTRMRIGRSRALLLEMPMETWTKRMLNDLLELHTRKEYCVVLAHMDRYIPYQRPDVFAYLAGNGIRMQCNASFFTRLTTGRKAIRLLEAGLIHMLGSDCHNLTTRPPNLGEACDKLVRKGYGGALERVMESSMEILSDTAEMPEIVPAEYQK